MLAIVVEQIRALKEGLTDPAQKQVRNRELLEQMLALDEPTLTPKVRLLGSSCSITRT